MYKRVIWSLISLMIIVIIYFGTVIYNDFKTLENERSEPTPIVKTIPEDEDIKTIETVSQNEIIEIVDNDYQNPFNQKYNQRQLTDESYRDYIHKMSHQKVVAESKWVFFEMTDERIDWLLKSLDQEDIKRTLTDGDIYLDILTRWKNKDFSQVDKDHNTVWELQGGGTENSVGEATGIADEESEKSILK